MIDTWGPLGETFLSLTTLQHPAGPAVFGGWRQRVRQAQQLITHPAAALFQGGFVDLFTVTGPAASWEEGLEALRNAGSDLMRQEFAGARELREHYTKRSDRWAGLAWGDPAHDRGDREALVDFLDGYYRVAVAPYWSGMRTRLQQEQAGRARVYAEQGVEAMLARLPPGFRWRSPILEIGRGATVYEFHLGGRGLVLVPSVFYQSRPTVFFSPDGQEPAVLFVPVLRTTGDAAGVLTTTQNGTLKELEALLGRTRARALDAIGQVPCTTSQLAQRLNVSLASASEHATVLRRAGLITTIRHGSAVHHSVTPLGTGLLNGMSPAP
ncbi:winged helix-turn-helix transcriptional regulator [Streptomyces pactum]|uniref:Winged helix-turn-helix transcriptional regulator n=1 Tax=Streptomyces pactum TaxID=68249 RepID=A0ABS0NUB4_9ACTN|nr:winged helix-turn-helix domain-containing protein [Streptomyces pactum]MBH5338799.1 winged helix-turn-helix transcriptional regulator [Streptomyces pactum]